MLAMACLIAALICFGLAAIGVASKVNLIALGLFFLVLSNLLPALR